MKKLVLPGLLVCLVVMTGCTSRIEDSNASAKEAASFGSPRAVFDAINAGGVETAAFTDKGEAEGPSGVAMFSSADVLFDSGSSVTILVFPTAFAEAGGHDEYALKWLEAARDSGVEDPVVLRGPNWIITGFGDLSDIQEALGGELRQ